ncbi:helix-turn-helix transcriptional regulator [Lacunimicrobium album]
MSTLIFDPDYTSPPGDTLEEWLEEHGMSQLQLATRLGMSKKTVNQIIQGVAPLTLETAEKLELVTGITASFWSTREANHQRRKLQARMRLALAEEAEWLKEPAVKKLIKSGLVTRYSDKAEQVRACLKYYHCASVGAWREANKKNLLVPTSTATAVKLSGKRT